MYLCLDVAYRAIGYVTLTNKGHFISSGLISSSDKKVTFLYYEDGAFKESKFELEQDYEYINLQYFDTVKLITIFLSELFDKFPDAKILAEIPHSGAQSHKATFQMALALALTSSTGILKDRCIIPIHPSSCKNYMKEKLNKTNITKNDTIDFVKNVFPEVILPKQKGFQHHICDAYIVWLTYTNGGN